MKYMKRILPRQIMNISDLINTTCIRGTLLY